MTEMELIVKFRDECTPVKACEPVKAAAAVAHTHSTGDGEKKV